MNKTIREMVVTTLLSHQVTPVPTLVADLESLFREYRRATRISEGMEAARKEGTKLGRKTLYTKKDEDKIIKYLRQGLSIREVAEQTGFNRGKVHAVAKALDREVDDLL